MPLTAGMPMGIERNVPHIPKYGMIGAAYAALITDASSGLFVIFVPKTRE